MNKKVTDLIEFHLDARFLDNFIGMLNPIVFVSTSRITEACIAMLALQWLLESTRRVHQENGRLSEEV